MKKQTRKHELRTQVLQFSAIGGINALVDIGALNLLLFFWPTNDNDTLIILNTIAYTLAIINSYIFNSNLTFKKRSHKNKKEIVFFIIQAIASLAISNVVLIAGVAMLDNFAIPTFIQQNIAKGLAMFFSSTASFFFMRYFVFRQKKRKVW